MSGRKSTEVCGWISRIVIAGQATNKGKGVNNYKMSGETNLDKLLKAMQPFLNEGEFVFCSIANTQTIPTADLLFTFKENEGLTVVLKKELADALQLHYTFIASWITLTVHSSLEAVGLTAAFSNALATAGISCNVVAAFYHDHIFINKTDTEKAMEVLNGFALRK